MKTDKILVTHTHRITYRADDTTVKIFDRNYPKADVLNEALNQAGAEETGLPIPRVLSANITEGGNWCITSDYVEGRTLQEIIDEGLKNFNKYTRDFVALRLEAHSKKVPLLTKLKGKWDGKIISLTAIGATVRYELRTCLSNMLKYTKALHGGFNPTDVIVDVKGQHHILNWSYTIQGNTSVDAATTYLLFTSHDQKMADLCADAFCEMSDTVKQHAQRWPLTTATSRLGKGIPGEKSLFEKWLDAVEYE